MTQSELLRNNLITKLLSIKDEELLSAIDTMISRIMEKNSIELSEEEMRGIEMSKKEYDNGQAIDHTQLIREELEWLKKQ